MSSFYHDCICRRKCRIITLMADVNKTSVSIREDKATGLSSRIHGANNDVVAFNLDLIASKKPAVAVRILDLYEEAKNITSDTPVQSDEDFGLAADKLRKFIDNIDD